MTVYLSNRDGDGKTSEEGHYKFQTAVWAGAVLGDSALEVTQNSPTGMSVRIAIGQFKIDTSDGYAYTGWNSASYVQSISTSDPANPRISTVVAYVDKGEATSPSPPNNPGIVKFLSVNGTPASFPTPPSEITIQTAVGAGNPYIILANISVPASTTQIFNANIADTRTRVTLGTNLVDSNSLRDSAVATAKLADSAVTTAKLANLSVTSGKIANGAIDDAKWRNGIAFSALRVAALTITGSSFGKFSCDSILYNIGNAYSNTSNIGRFTAPVTGVYAFNARLNSRGSTNTRAIIEFRINGSSSAQYPRTQDIGGPNGTVLASTNASRMFFLNAGDYIEAWAWVQVTTNIASGQGQLEHGTQFEGYLVTRT